VTPRRAASASKRRNRPPSHRRASYKPRGEYGVSPPDPLFEQRIKFLGVAQDAQLLGRTDGKLVDARKQLKKLALAARQILDRRRRRFVRCAGRIPPMRRPGGESCAVLEPPTLSRSVRKGNRRWGQETDKENCPEPGERRGGPLLQKQEMRDGRPGSEIAEKENDLHVTEGLRCSDRTRCMLGQLWGVPHSGARAGTRLARSREAR